MNLSNWEQLLVAVLLGAGTLFWLVFIIWENEQRRKESEVWKVESEVGLFSEWYDMMEAQEEQHGWWMALDKEMEEEDGHDTVQR